jgi:acetyl-CoA carboxylase carboxyl transferase subunit beta
MGWFGRSDRSDKRDSRIPEGLWVKCDGCKEALYRKELEKTLHVCPRCGFHHRIPARTRLAQLFDNGEFKELFTNIYSSDPLGFVDSKPYADRLRSLREKGMRQEAIVIAGGRVGGARTIIGAMEYAFMGGSMGSVVGEKVCRAAEEALKLEAPLVVISCSGGARMQESVQSLMQMAKVSAALGRLHEAGIPYLSVMTDPTTGGVTASYAMLGDVNIAEPKALIGFAGPRVIEQTIRQKLPEGFQRSEFLLEKGFLDLVVHRSEMRDTLIRLIGLFAGKTAAP